VAVLRLDPLVTDAEADLSDLWMAIAAWLREQNPPADLAQRIDDGLGVDAVIGAEDAADRFAADVYDVYIDSGQHTAHWLDGLIAAALLSFDATSDNATAWAAQNVADVRAAIVSDIRGSATRLIADGRVAGRDTLTIAGDVTAGLGMTEYQAGTITTYRRALESGDLSNALERELRDARSDRTLEQALRDGTAISRSQIDAMVRRYAMGVLRSRADTLGLFEGSYAVHGGALEAIEQAIRKGSVAGKRLKQRWRSKRDQFVRHTHAVLDGKSVALGESFESSSGVLLRFPRDPNAPARETRGCRCKLELVFE
jgi:hypothetical protein